MTKLLTATFALALLLTGCGANPGATNRQALRAAQSASRPAPAKPMKVEIAHTLEARYAGSHVRSVTFAEREDDRGTYTFTAALVDSAHHNTSVDGEIDMPTRNVRIFNISETP